MRPSSPLPSPALAATVEHVFERPDDLVEAIRRQGGHWNQVRYVPVPAAAAFAAGHPLVGRDSTQAPPLFRSDWWRWGPVEGSSRDAGEGLARHRRLADASGELFGARHVVPTQIHVNLNVPGRVHDAGHVDVPVFRGLDRRNAPGWLLLALARSGRAERWSVRTATAVIWLYRGDGGGFTWWPDGTDAPPATICDLWNRAIVMDADSLPHRVDPLADVYTPVPPLGRHSRLDDEPGGDGWSLRDGFGRTFVLPREAVRISISWKAATFTDDEERDAYLGGVDPLKMDVARTLLGDEVGRRGGNVTIDDDHEFLPVDDPRFVAEVERTIPRLVPTGDLAFEAAR